MCGVYSKPIGPLCFDQSSSNGRIGVTSTSGGAAVQTDEGGLCRGGGQGAAFQCKGAWIEAKELSKLQQGMLCERKALEQKLW